MLKIGEKMKNLCLFFLILFMLSCGEKHETEIFLAQNQHIVAVPLHGCSDCIEKTLSWVAANKTNTKIAFVIVGNPREKSVKKRFSKQDLQAKNIHFDTTGYCIKWDILTAQPICIVKDKNNKQLVTKLTDSNFDREIANFLRVLNSSSTD
jgi:hypothetical protein